MLEKIEFSENDILYILGDILDRGPNPIKIVLDVMKRFNVEVIAGNHEVMAMKCLKFLLKEITKNSIANINEEIVENFLNWQQNGADSTIEEFCKLNKETRKEVIEFILNFELYDEISVNDNTFVLVHAGLGNFEVEKEMWEYELDDLVWNRTNYDVPYYKDKIVITGHTPTMAINNNPNPGYIFKANNHIAIDCGCSVRGGRLGCLRLNDMKEFYIELE